MTGYDLIIKNARIIDGTGSAWFRGDLGINGDKICFIGKLREEVSSCKVIDARDQFLAPGFIDVHTHSDFWVLRDPQMLSKIKQGVTTQFIGQCGISPAPIRGEVVDLLDKYSGFIQAGSKPDWSWRSFSDYLDLLEELNLGTNIASFVGHGTIRLNVMGFDKRSPSNRELMEIKKLVEDIMEEGAFGISSGLIYPPGVYSDREEMVELCRVLEKYNGLYHSHIRNETDQVISAVKEFIYVLEKSGISGQISHHKVAGKNNFGSSDVTLGIIEEARLAGVDLTLDQYPYNASSTNLRSILPSWVHEGGQDKLIERLENPDTRARIRNEINNTDDWENIIKHCDGPEGVLIVYTPETPEFEGRNLVEVGEIMGENPLEAAFDLINVNRGSDTACFFSMDEGDVKNILSHPLVMIGSDSIPVASGGRSHPRTNGTFPRVLGKYVREEGVLRLEEAVWKMTGFPASRLNLQNKGLIRTGMDADLLIFDPETISGRASFINPDKDPTGINHVIINGEPIISEGSFTGRHSGRVIRRES